MAATIRDVAKLAGTSVSAVSAVLNDGGRHNIRVSTATRERIRAAAAQLGYSPNPLAKGLVTGKTGVLGLVFPYSRAFTDRNPFCTEIMSGVFEGVVSRGYNLMLHTAIGEDWNHADQNALLDPRVDGLILVLPPAQSPVVARCERRGFPCVSIVCEPCSPESYAINADDFGGGRMATEHLLSRGHRRIAHLMGTPGIASTEPRRCGYLAALEAAGIPPEEALMVPAGFHRDGGYQGMKLLLELPEHLRPTALFAANDLCAEGALHVLHEHGIRVPEEMAVVGFDDSWVAAMSRPPLTSVHMPIFEMGMRATQMLIELVEGREVAERQPVLPVSLTVRESSGA